MDKIIFQKFNVSYIQFIWMLADMMMNMGYSRKEIEESLIQQKYNDVMATYLLLARRGSDVSCIASLNKHYKTFCDHDVALPEMRISEVVFFNNKTHSESHNGYVIGLHVSVFTSNTDVWLGTCIILTIIRLQLCWHCQNGMQLLGLRILHLSSLSFRTHSQFMP